MVSHNNLYLKCLSLLKQDNIAMTDCLQITIIKIKLIRICHVINLKGMIIILE